MEPYDTEKELYIMDWLFYHNLKLKPSEAENMLLSELNYWMVLHAKQ